MRLSIKNMKCGLLCFEVVLPPGAFLFTVPQFSEPRMAQKWLASFCSQRYNADSQRYEKRSPSLSAKDTGKGWGAFLTTDPTTHRPGPHGNSMVKEAQRWSGAEPKQLKMAGNARKKFQGLVRIRKVEGSIPFGSTKEAPQFWYNGYQGCGAFFLPKSPDFKGFLAFISPSLHQIKR